MPVIRDDETKKLDVSILGGNSGRAVTGNPVTKWHVLEDRTMQQYRTEYWGPTVFSESLMTRVEQRDYRLDMGELVRFRGAHPSYCGEWGFVENEEDLHLIAMAEEGSGEGSVGASFVPNELQERLNRQIPGLNLWKETKAKKSVMDQNKMVAERPLEEDIRKNSVMLGNGPKNGFTNTEIKSTNSKPIQTANNNNTKIMKDDNSRAYDDMS